MLLRGEEDGEGAVLAFDAVLVERHGAPAIDASEAGHGLVEGEVGVLPRCEELWVALTFGWAVVEVVLRVVERGGDEGFWGCYGEAVLCVVGDGEVSDVGMGAGFLGACVGVEL